MKKLAFIVAAASLFALSPVASRFGPVASSVLVVWLGVLVAICASGSVQSYAVASGAVGALGSGILASLSPACAGAVMVALAFAERTARIRSRNARAVHVLLALVGGAVAGSLSTAFGGASVAVMAVAAVVAAVVAALPLLVEADDPLAHALDQAAAAVSEPARTTLAEGAQLRRDVAEVMVDHATHLRVAKTWQSLLRLAEARVRLEHSRRAGLVRIALPEAVPSPPSAADAVREMVDQRLREHVTVLTKATAAVVTARAAAVGLDDADLRTVESIGDGLEDTSRALIEVKEAT